VKMLMHFSGFKSIVKYLGWFVWVYFPDYSFAKLNLVLNGTVMAVEFCYFRDFTANQKEPSSRMCIVHTGNNTVSSKLCCPSLPSLRVQRKIDSG